MRRDLDITSKVHSMSLLRLLHYRFSLFGALVLSVCVFTSIFFSTVSFASSDSVTWEQLVDSNLSKWDVFMGVPHKSSNIPGYEDVEDVRKGTPLGLNNDPKKVFSVITENDELVIKITGEVFAGLVTKNEYQNYHFKAQFKWGDKKWPPRLHQKRNSGILYHSVGNFDDFWNVWMSSLEFEVQETDTGDFITISDTSVQAKCPSRQADDGKYYYSPDAPLVDMAWKKGFVTGRCWKNQDTELAHGQWNTVELIAFNDMALHIVNSTVIMAIYHPKYHNGEQWVRMQKGKIQLQSEAAEIYYKNIAIKPIQRLPQEYAVYLKDTK